MTRGDLPGIAVWGRPIKPVALGLSMSMLVLCVFNTIDAGVLLETQVGDVVAVMSGIAAFLLIAGWVGKSQMMAEWGLFLAGMTMTLRSAFLFVLQGGSNIGVWLGVGTAVVAFGAFLLERTDENRGSLWSTHRG